MATKDVNFRLKVELLELLKDVAMLLQTPQVKIMNDAVYLHLQTLIKENKLDEDLEMLRKSREKRKKK